MSYSETQIKLSFDVLRHPVYANSLLATLNARRSPSHRDASYSEGDSVVFSTVLNFVMPTPTNSNSNATASSSADPVPQVSRCSGVKRIAFDTKIAGEAGRQRKGLHAFSPCTNRGYRLMCLHLMPLRCVYYRYYISACS